METINGLLVRLAIRDHGPLVYYYLSIAVIVAVLTSIGVVMVGK